MWNPIASEWTQPNIMVSKLLFPNIKYLSLVWDNTFSYSNMSYSNIIFLPSLQKQDKRITVDPRILTLPSPWPESHNIWHPFTIKLRGVIPWVNGTYPLGAETVHSKLCQFGTPASSPELKYIMNKDETNNLWIIGMWKRGKGNMKEKVVGEITELSHYLERGSCTNPRGQRVPNTIYSNRTTSRYIVIKMTKPKKEIRTP